ncbi:ferredoxin-NADP reductase [Brevibacterium sanguinis]|uniref:Ferredoxin-NADP reductase n=2 Tax=Brevibacterium TaxID=1696 RepID=A0A366IKZ3_9MICO|nr:MULTISPECIES: PDR/VanB family oxidoreductase [Brevibacterium]RBP65624.1 ferredoxin-NADP reductase [Brevibacterium sanguinis]RBP72258.1 ferredoxin-NADP reductase [Brevibacterium celere]
MTHRTSAALRLARRRTVADDVVALTLEAADGGRLPDWEPGAHIDLILPADGAGAGMVRQYSLCGDRWKPCEYTIMVQREPDGRGGSAALHDEVSEGDLLGFGGPRNNFRLAPAEEYLFIAGGIGITPLLPMIEQANRLDVAWRLLYLGRSASRLAALDRLAVLAGDEDRVTIHDADRLGRADLESWRPTDPAVRVFACGPVPLLDAIAAWGAVPGGLPPRVERFTAQDGDGPTPAAFEVIASRSGVSAQVGESESVVDALRRAGVDIITSCAKGVCGTCETDVLEGNPDHRDSLLDDHERALGDCMFPCVSRSRDPRLVLGI